MGSQPVACAAKCLTKRCVKAGKSASFFTAISNCLASHSSVSGTTLMGMLKANRRAVASGSKATPAPLAMRRHCASKLGTRSLNVTFQVHPLIT